MAELGLAAYPHVVDGRRVVAATVEQSQSLMRHVFAKW